MWLSWRHGLPLGTGIWGGEDAEFEPRRLRRTWRLSRFWPTTWNQSQSVSPSGYLIWLAASAAPSTDCPPAAQHETPSRQGSLCCRCRCSLRGCPPSPLAALLAGSWCPVPGCSVSGFPACSRDARRPGEVSAPGLAVLLGRAWAAASRGVAFPAVVLHPAAVSHAPAQFSSTQEQETAPAPPGNKLSQPLPRNKNYPGNPGRPVASVARAAPGVAGGSRDGPSRRPMLAGMNASTAPPPPPVPRCGAGDRHAVGRGVRSASIFATIVKNRASTSLRYVAGSVADCAHPIRPQPPFRSATPSRNLSREIPRDAARAALLEFAGFLRRSGCGANADVPHPQPDRPVP